MFDLCCGLGGATEGFLAEGWECIGIDIERHIYGEHRYPAQLWIQNLLTIDGAQLRDANFLWASVPCQEFSYMAMPWSRAKQIERALRGENEFPEGYQGSRTFAELTALFDACFRIQREACEAAGHHIPLIVENVKGAQKWVGRARWHFGSFYLWGDVPALMPAAGYGAPMKYGKICHSPADWERVQGGEQIRHTHGVDPRARLGVKQHGSGAAWLDKALDERRKEATAIKNGGDWFGPGDACSLQRRQGSKSTGRKAASAMIAKIPLPLSRHIGRCFRDHPPSHPECTSARAA